MRQAVLLLGVKSVAYTSKQKVEVKAVEVSFVDLASEVEGQQGWAVKNAYIPNAMSYEEAQSAIVPCNAELTFHFEEFNRQMTVKYDAVSFGNPVDIQVVPLTP